MGDIFDKIKSLFSQSVENKKPFVHEMIERSEEELAATEAWGNSPQTTDLFERIYDFIQNGQEENSCFHLFENERSHSFVIYFKESGLNSVEMLYLFDTMKTKVLGHSYQLYMSDRKIIPEADSVIKTIERHYLKPKRKNISKTKKAEQQYGNIAIEFHLRDDEPEFIKLNASYYQDQLYKEVKSFSELLLHIFK